MSFLARPTVVFAIVFGCFAVLIPRVFLPIFRSKSSTTAPNYDDRKLRFPLSPISDLLINLSIDFRRPPSPVIRNDPADHVEQIPVRFFIWSRLMLSNSCRFRVLHRTCAELIQVCECTILALMDDNQQQPSRAVLNPSSH